MQFTDNNKVNLLKNQLMPAALTWISAALSVKPVVGNLFLNKFCQVTDGQGNCIQYRDPTPCQDVASVPAEHLAQTVGATGIANADYILYITSLPTTGNTLAYAGACQDDQNGRPIAGAANFDETKLKLAATGSFDHDNQVALVIHEIFHALGFSSDYFTRFKDENGNPRTGVVKTFNERGLTVSKITTPNVLREAAAQYNCAGLNGMEIEQQGGQGTAGSHWEQRIVGNELMGGALFPNVIAKSRITLALLADSGWYVVNYNAADTMYWGKNKGCNFATAKCLTPGATPTSIDPETFCTTKDEVSCSPGRTARGICLVADFNAPLDAAFQYFTNNPNRGGTSSLTDFCPLYVTLNYNDKLGVCNYAESQPNANQNFFGETFGTSSRCFTSTLVGQNFQGVTVLGAGCYPQRCNNGVLEIQINNNFVPCPVAGGKITAAGFTGDLTCPPAASMCDVPAGTSPSSSPSQASASASPSTGSSVSPSTSRPGSASSTSAPSVTPSNTLPPSASSSPGSAPSPSSSPAPPSAPPSRSSVPSAPPSTSPAPSFVPKPSSVPPPAPPPTCDVDPLKKLQDLKALCEPGDVCSPACTAAIADFKTSTKNCCTPGLTDEIITTFTLIDNRCKRTCTKTDFAAKWASTYTACSNATLGNCPATCAQRVTAFAEEFRVCFGIIVTQPLPVNPAPLTDEYALLFVRSQLSSIQALCAASSVAQCTKDNILPVSLWARSVCERDGCAAASCANASRLLDATKDDCFGPNGVPDAWKAYLADSCTNPFPCVVQLRAAALDVKLACVALSTGNCTAACQDARTKYETLASKCGCGKPVDPFVSLERDSKGSCRGCGSAVADALKAARAGCVADGTCSDNCRVLVQAARVAIGKCYFDAPAPRALMDQFDSLNDFCERPKQPTCRLSVSEAQAALQECSLGICTQACRDAAKDFRAVVKTCFNDSVPPSTFNAWRRVLGVCGGNSIARITVTSPQGPAGAVLKLVFNSIVRALQVTDASVVALVNYQPGASGATIDVQVPTNLVDTLVTLATSNRIPPLNVSGASKLPNDVDSSVLTLSAFYNATACSALNQVDVMQQLRELCTDSCDSICQNALTRARSIFSTCCVPGVTEDIKTAIVSIDLRCRFSATCTKVQVIDATYKLFTACKSSKYGACTTECSQAVQTYSNFIKGCYNVDDTAPVTTPAGQIAQDDILNLAKNVVSNIRNLCTAAPVTCTKDDILPVVLSSRVVCETFGVCSVPCKQMILKVKDSINDCFQSSQAPNTLKDFANDECPDISDKTCLNQLNDASFDVKTACGSAQTCSDACKTARQNFENLIRRCTCGRPEDAQADSLSQSQASCLACVPDVETAFTNAVVTCRTAGKCTTACQTAIQNAKTKTEACFTTNIPKGYTNRLAVLQISFCGNNEKTCTLDVSDKLAAAQQCGDGICTPACQSALLELREAVRTCYAPGTVPDTINTEWRRLRATCGNVAIRKYSVKTSVNFNDATARNNWLKLFRATLASVSDKTEDFFAFVSATPVTNLKRENGIEVNIQGDPATIAAATGNGIPSLTSSQLQTNAVAATPDGLTGEATTTTTTTTTTANTAAPGLTVINFSFADLIR